MVSHLFAGKHRPAVPCGGYKNKVVLKKYIEMHIKNIDFGVVPHCLAHKKTRWMRFWRCLHEATDNSFYSAERDERC